MADRIISMRALLKENLEKLGSKQNWNHITDQVWTLKEELFQAFPADENIDWHVRIHWLDRSRNGQACEGGKLFFPHGMMASIC